MTFDVFISYPHQDKTAADAACAKLESTGIRCWIAPRDIAPSSDWASAIVDAIDACCVMVLVFSGHANRSKQVQREVQQAFESEKPVVPLRIENVSPEKKLRYYMGPVHWLDALTPPLEQHLEKLVACVTPLVRPLISDTAIPNRIVQAAKSRHGRRVKKKRAKKPLPSRRECCWSRKSNKERTAGHRAIDAPRTKNFQRTAKTSIPYLLQLDRRLVERLGL